jgi:hypothetical protein
MLAKIKQQFANQAFKRILFGSLLILLTTTLVLVLMDRNNICECGYVKLWHGIIFSSENSQHLTDPYTFTHIVHGLLLYAIIQLVLKKWSFSAKLLLAIFLESAWEIVENTSFVIEHYRAVTISLDYYGDSVINSLSDIIAAIVGFLIAYKVKVWQSVAIFFIVELVLLWFIRDNLTLNIIMLFFPIEAIKQWQFGY